MDDGMKNVYRGNMWKRAKNEEFFALSMLWDHAIAVFINSHSLCAEHYAGKTAVLPSEKIASRLFPSSAGQVISKVWAVRVRS